MASLNNTDNDNGIVTSILNATGQALQDNDIVASARMTIETEKAHPIIGKGIVVLVTVPLNKRDVQDCKNERKVTRRVIGILKDKGLYGSSAAISSLAVKIMTGEKIAKERTFEEDTKRGIEMEKKLSKPTSMSSLPSFKQRETGVHECTHDDTNNITVEVEELDIPDVTDNNIVKGSLDGKKIGLAGDSINTDLRDALTKLITAAGGSVSNNTKDIDCLVVLEGAGVVKRTKAATNGIPETGPDFIVCVATGIFEFSDILEHPPKITKVYRRKQYRAKPKVTTSSGTTTNTSLPDHVDVEEESTGAALASNTVEQDQDPPADDDGIWAEYDREHGPNALGNSHLHKTNPNIHYYRQQKQSPPVVQKPVANDAASLESLARDVNLNPVAMSDTSTNPKATTDIEKENLTPKQSTNQHNFVTQAKTKTNTTSFDMDDVSTEGMETDDDESSSNRKRKSDALDAAQEPLPEPQPFVAQPVVVQEPLLEPQPFVAQPVEQEPLPEPPQQPIEQQPIMQEQERPPVAALVAQEPLPEQQPPVAAVVAQPPAAQPVAAAAQQGTWVEDHFIPAIETLEGISRGQFKPNQVRNYYKFQTDDTMKNFDALPQPVKNEWGRRMKAQYCALMRGGFFG